MKNFLIFSILLIFASCLKIESTYYHVRIFNQSNFTLLVEYKTIDKEKTTLLLTERTDFFFENLYTEFFDGNDNLIQYSSDEFNNKVISVKLSIINETDTIPISKDFAPFENWTYRENYDDNTISHDYALLITDEMLD